MRSVTIDINYQPLQRAVYDSKSPWKGLECGRGYGKTYLMHSMLLQDLLLGKRCIMTAQTTRILNTQFMPSLLSLAKSWGLPLVWRETKGYAELGKGIVFLGSYENFETAIVGADKIASGYYDELAKCSNFDWFQASIAPCFRASGFSPKHVFATTPKRGCRFDKWLKENAWVFVARGGTIDDNPHVSAEDRATMKMGLTGDLYKQEILGESLDGDVEFAVFPAEIFPRERKPQSGFASLGIDCAGSGRDFNVFVVCDDTGILEIEKVQKADTFALNATANRLIDKWSCKLVNIDCTGGFGNGLFDLLSVTRDFVNAINFGQRANDEKSYANARAEMFFNLADDLRNGFFVDDREIREELEIISFDTTNSGKSQLIAKEVIKKVLRRSPDASDALALSRYNREKAEAASDEERYDVDRIAAEMSGW